MLAANGDEEAKKGGETTPGNKRFIIIDEHKGHYVKDLKTVINQAESEKHRLKD